MKILSLLWLLFLFSCVEKNPGTSILTTGIFNQATFSINGQDASGKTIDLGEHLLTDPAIVATVKIYNGTDFPYTDLLLEFLPFGEQSSSTNFLQSEDGSVNAPGKGGTCSKTLAPKTSCTMMIEINPREGRVFNEIVKLSYKQFVEPEEHLATIQFLAGMPASLIFTGDKESIYNFGVLAGPEKRPTVERADGLLMEEHLEIKNVGGLSAKDLKLKLDEFCIGLKTSACPNGMFGAYRMEHNCPVELAPNEVCQLSIYYRPLNQNPPGASEEFKQEIEEITYDATFTADYITSSSGKSAVLPAYFKSVSSEIKARFTTINKIIDFETEIISGNRDKRAFSLQNRGTRSGYLLYISFHDQNDQLIADCYPQEGSNLLSCVDGAKNPLPLSTFPFFVQDNQSCLSTETTKKDIAVAASCNFEIFFQPSVTFTTPKTTEFQDLRIYATWDALYQGKETITTSEKELSTLKAKSTSQAQLIVERIRLGTTDYYLSSHGLPSLADLGRLALQSAQYGVSKPMQVTFKNIGKTRATNIQIRDGLNRVIPIGGSPISLGAHGPHYYYKRVQGNSSYCSFIDEGGQCTITMNFLPTALNDSEKENANMFDSFIGDTGFKSFIISYDSGVQYTDTNLQGEKDYPIQQTEAKITAKLIYKGFLMELADDARNKPSFGGGSNANDEIFYHLYLRNIGTGPIKYLQALSIPPNISWSLVTTPQENLQDLGAEYDCLDIVDTELVEPINPNIDPALRGEKVKKLRSGESCVYTVRVKQGVTNRMVNASSCANEALAEEESSRLFYQASNNTSELWEVCQTYLKATWPTIRFRYFDGDVGAGGSSHPQFGFESRTETFEIGVNSSPVNKLSFINFTPFLTATAYRPEFTLPDLGTGAPHQQETIIPEAWFYGLLPNIYTDESDPAVPTLIKAGQARHFVPLLKDSWELRGGYEYVYYAGSFPKNSGVINFTPTLQNGAASPLYVSDYIQTPVNDGKIQVTSKTDLGIPKTLAPTISLNASLNTNTAQVGEHAHEVSITFNTGEHVDPLYYIGSTSPQEPLPEQKTKTLKFLIVANVTDDHPRLSAEVINYEMKFGPSGELLTPDPSDPVAVALSWNYQPEAANIKFSNIKIPGTPGPNDPYDKKTIKLTNTGTKPIEDLKHYYRAQPTSALTASISGNLKIVNGETDCGDTLAAEASCNLTLIYRPNNSDTSQNALLTFMYRSPEKEYFMQNLGLSLQPDSPGKLAVIGRGTQSIRYKATPTSSPTVRTSYLLALPSSQYLNDMPTTRISFTENSGTLAKVTLTNPEPTKTSLLLAYQRYVTQHSKRSHSPANPAPSSLIPLEGEYIEVSESIGTVKYTTIFENKYDDQSTRLRVEASKGCFFGDDEPGIPSYQKGFNKDTSASNPCYLRFFLYANLDYLNKEIRHDNGDHMRENALELWYYTYNRSATASSWFHMTGTLLPPPSTVTGGYGNVTALDSRQISFRTPHFSPSYPLLGEITGVRVYRTTISTNLNNLYKSPTTDYVDIRTQSPEGHWVANFPLGLQNGHFYYFRPVAIRQHPSFAHTAERFPGLLPGEYISQAPTSSVPVLSVPVPPLGHYYLHNLKAVVNKSLQVEMGGYTWEESNTICKGTKFTFKAPGNLEKQYQMISGDLWETIKGIPAAHSYSHLNTPHWIDHAPVSIDEELGQLGLPYAQDSALYEDHGIYYLKDPNQASALVRIIVGGVPLADYSDFISFVPPNIGFGNVRCVIYLE